LATAAYFAIWQNKENNKKPHLTSWHSWFGCTAWVFMLLQLVWGAGNTFLPSMFRPGAPKTGSPYVWVDKWHAYSGFLLVITITITLGLAMATNFIQYAVGFSGSLALGACILVAQGALLANDA